MRYTYPLTVKELLKECTKQVASGNGDKYIFISADDEGNYFHPLFYTFTPNDGNYEDVFNYYGTLSKDNTIILG